jgi:hypothetical protein
MNTKKTTKLCKCTVEYFAGANFSGTHRRENKIKNKSSRIGNSA